MNNSLGPVSSSLEAELRRTIQRHGIVLWLDPDKLYAGFIQQLLALRNQAELPYEVHTFRGSHLELLLGFEHLEGGVEKTPLLIHLPSLDEKLICESPLLGFYKVSGHFQKDLDDIVTEA